VKEAEIVLTEKWRATFHHGLKFYSVGALGIGVQLATLSLLVGVLRMNYLFATILAVEAAVLHNFIWHHHWTWVDRKHGGVKEILLRLIRINLTTGAFSILGNVIFMRIFVGYAHMHYFPAQLLSIAACSILNFLVSDRFVFRKRRHETL
jgi:putative flippase GtrA